MNSVKTYGMAIVLTTLAAGASAQVSKTVPGVMETLTVTVEKASREVTIKKPDGTYGVFSVPADVKRFDTLKVGDKITAKYYENIVLRLKAPGEKPVDSENGGVTRAANRNAATAAVQRTITATITKVDMKVPSIAFSGPNGWNYSTRVQDKDTLAKVKVGDKVDITWTEAAILSIEDAK
jgi:uncharacterized protein with beta-barrel porin domain